ncbi:MAG TPA: Gfo/Idh/MocA family oxidoreductase [Oculatellaceae cyanobacterium]
MNRLGTAIIGFGQIAQGYASDPQMRIHFRYATHAQVLQEHPAFEWKAVVDISDDALHQAQDKWGIQHVARAITSLQCLEEIEVAVIATPPEHRVGLIESMPALKAILVEKPLGRTIQECQQFLDICERRQILVQVNLLRRTDSKMQELAGGRLRQLIGLPQCTSVFYGNGLMNNGTHMIDLVRMLIGEVLEVRAISNAADFEQGPVSGDRNFSFSLAMNDGSSCILHPLRFDNYRENSIDIWGEHGRLSVIQEGLTMLRYEAGPHRAMEGCRELACDNPTKECTGISTALYEMYTNLNAGISVGTELASSGVSALRTAAVVQAAFTSLHHHGSPVCPDNLLLDSTENRVVLA